MDLLRPAVLNLQTEPEIQPLSTDILAANALAWMKVWVATSQDLRKVVSGWREVNDQNRGKNS